MEPAPKAKQVAGKHMVAAKRVATNANKGSDFTACLEVPFFLDRVSELMGDGFLNLQVLCAKAYQSVKDD